MSLLAVGMALGLGGVPVKGAADPVGNVEVARLPGGGVQPQFALGEDGTVHRVYLSGDPRASDVWYAVRPRGSKSFSEPRRVNSIPGSAMAVGTIRGAQLAAGSDGVVHVVWNGNGEATGHPGAPLWYARGTRDSSFTPQVDAIQSTEALDGGGAVALDAGGGAVVIWHAAPAGQSGEIHRTVWTRRIGGRDWAWGKEERLGGLELGACGCCGLEAIGAPDGRLAVLYRAAGEGVHRDAILAVRSGSGAEVRSIRLEEWPITTCPMSSASLAWHGDGVLAAWETREEIHWAFIQMKNGAVQRLTAPSGTGKRKHPTVMVGKDGRVLLGWVEGTGWNRGGSVAWSVFDADLKGNRGIGRADGVPVWGMAAGCADPEGGFLLAY